MITTQHDASSQIQYLTFRVAGEEYAISILNVREILAFEAVTPVPNAPAAIRGVMNLRGFVVPVIDLAAKLALPPTKTTRTTCNVIVDVRLGDKPAIMGIMVDAVSEVIDLTPSDIEPPPLFGARLHAEYLAGMGKVGGKLIMLLNLDHLLSTDELLRPDEAPILAEAGGETIAASA
jgi:purine-binding chemotaxis protein CheW